MIGSEIRTLVVGAVEPVWGRVDDQLNRDLSAELVEVRAVGPDGVPPAWSAPSLVDMTSAATGLVRAALTHTATVAGLWELQVKIGTAIVKCGPFQVVDA